jgi:membrane fusion protein, multidrug efflux system
MSASTQTLQRMRRWLGLTMLAVGIIGASHVFPHGGDAAAQPGEGKGEKPAVTVMAEVLAPTLLPQFCEVTGTVRSQTTTVLSSKVVGYVRVVLVKEGDRVQTGRPLILLDDRDLGAQLRRAEAALEEAQNAVEEVVTGIAAAEASRAAAAANNQFATATLQRYQMMLEQRTVSRQEFDAVQAKQQSAKAELERTDAAIKSLQAKKRQALAKIAQAKAELANAQVYLSYATIRSPIDGIILEKKAEVGSLAAPGVPLLTIEDPRKYRLEVNVPESQISDVAVGGEVFVTIAALGQRDLVGNVGDIVPTADPASRTFLVKIDLPSVEGLRSGMYGKARCPTGERTALLIPRSAVLERGQLQSVYVVEDGKVARLRFVKTGKIYGDQVEILAGLKAAEMIVLEGTDRLVDGTAVEVHAR